MPELPEVETVRRGLAPVMEGARFVEVVAHRGDLRWPLPKDFAERLKGQTVERARPPRQISAGRSVVRRRAGDASRHVGLVPRRARRRRDRRPALLSRPRQGLGAHDHVVFRMSSGATIRFNDPRRFGSMKLVPRAKLDEEPLLRALGPEPLGNEFDAAMLAQACAGKKTSLKAALLDQRVVAGLGNIYVCEALNRARLSPKRKASTHRRPHGRAERARRRAGRRDQGGARRRDRGRRLVAARPPPHRRRARRFPAQLPGLRPRGQAVPDARLQRHDQAHRAERPLDVLLSGVSEVVRAPNALRARRHAALDPGSRLWRIVLPKDPGVKRI